MGRANIDNGANATVDKFFEVLGDPKTGNYLNLDYLMQYVFCPDANGPPQIPTVGVAMHGPSFTGAADVRRLFKTFFTSFPDMTFTQYPDKTARLYSRDGYRPPTIGIAANLNGTYQKPWFYKEKKGDRDTHYSKPLSDIIPVRGNFQSIWQPGIAAFAQFAFGDERNPTLVSQLSIYMDRYRFMSDLVPLSDASVSAYINQRGVARR
jgi:hypothetical protein